MADGPVGAAGSWVRANQRWLRFAVGIAGSVVLLWGVDVSVARLFWSLVAVLLALTVIQVLVGAGGAAPADRPNSPGAPSAAPASPTEQVLADAATTTVPSDRK